MEERIPIVQREPQITFDWYGPDGSVWDLRRGPVRTTVQGIRGLSMPELDFDLTESGAIDGQIMNGFRVKGRELFLPLRFYTNDVVSTQRAFWDSLVPGQYGTFVVSDGWGGVRSLRVRFKDDGGLAYTADPHLIPVAFGLTFVADDPWWHGREQVTEFDPPLPTLPAFGEAPGDPVLYISSSYENVGSRLIKNPGNADVWPVWRIRGAAEGSNVTAFRFAVGDEVISGSVNVRYDQQLEIDTNPRVQAATLTGRGVIGDGDVTDMLVDADFARVPARGEAVVSGVVVGVGVAEIVTVPQFYRAF